MSGKPCYVYIICFADGEGVKGPCKIGISNAVGARLAQVQTGSPHKMVLLGTLMIAKREFARDFERAIHNILIAKHMTGEWFDVEPPKAAGVVASFARMLFQGLLPDKAALEDLCEGTGATNLIRYFNMSLDEVDRANAGPLQ